MMPAGFRRGLWVSLAANVVAAVSFLGWSPAAGAAEAQAQPSWLAEIYSRAQAARGAELYDTHCAACHGPNLTGGRMSALKGEAFMSKWSAGNRTVEDFYLQLKAEMPYGQPDSLPPQQYVDIVAYILSNNGFAAGGNDLRVNSREIAVAKMVPHGAAPPAAESMEAAAANAPTFIDTGLRASSAAPTQAEMDAAAANTTDWLHSGHDYGGQRYADLRQINKRNVKSLRPAAMYQLADSNAFHNNPIVYQGVMYVATLTSVAAIDATTAKLLWRYNRKPRAPQGWTLSRGVAVKDGKVIRGTNDGYLLALDAKTGKLLWERKVGDRLKNEGGFTMAPVVYQDLVLMGPAGSEMGVKGWFGAFKLSNGEPVWRFNTVPDDHEKASDTWSTSEGRKTGGGAVWAPASLDPVKGLVYVPVANPYPDYQGENREGKNLYTSSMIVLDARTGKLQWYYQVSPHDLHDWDLTQVSPLFETTVAGKQRRLVSVVGKEGLLHVVDRETHEALYEVPVTRRENTESGPTVEGMHTCPGQLGGVQWNGPAFNPGTNMLYVPAVDWCATFKKAVRDANGKQTGGGNSNDPLEKSNGVLTAINASTGKVSWTYRSQRPMLAAVTTTSAELVFTGEVTGDFIALDAKSGEVLYRFNTGAPLNGGVITYNIAGKQYVAVASGNATGFWRAEPGSATIIIFSLPESN